VCDTIARWVVASPSDPGWSPSTWEVFRKACLVHGVAPLMHSRLGDAGWLDGATRSWLSTAYELNCDRVERIHAECRDILAACDREGVAVLPLKGLMLSDRYYDDPALRPMADLDLLVRPADLEPTALLLERLGYKRNVATDKHLDFLKPDNAEVVSFDHEHPDNPRRVEVHTHCGEVFGRTPVDLTDHLWADARDDVLDGERATILSADHLWLHLLVHASWQILYGGGRLIQLVDLAVLGPHLVEPLAALERVDSRATFLALALARSALPGAIAPQLVEEVVARVSPKLSTWVERDLDLLNTSHFNPRTICRALRLLRYHRGRPAELRTALGYLLLPRIREMHINQYRVKPSRWTWTRYPWYWAKHIGNLTLRS